MDKQAHHCQVQNTFKVNTKIVDLAGIKGKKVVITPLKIVAGHGEVSITTSWSSREVYSSTHRKLMCYAKRKTQAGSTCELITDEHIGGG